MSPRMESSVTINVLLYIFRPFFNTHKKNFEFKLVFLNFYDTSTILQFMIMINDPKIKLFIVV